MSQLPQIAFCLVLLFIAFSLLFFRKRIALWLAAHPGFTRLAAVILAALMMIGALIPLLIIAIHSTG